LKLLSVLRSDAIEISQRFGSQLRDSRNFRCYLYLALIVGIIVIGCIIWLPGGRTRANLAAIGPLIGLLGIAAAAFLNSYLTRQRDNELRQRDAVAMATSLAGEVGGFVQSMDHKLSIYPSEIKSASASIFASQIMELREEAMSPAYERIYIANIDRLGLLPLPLLKLVVQTYSLRHFMRFATSAFATPEDFTSERYSETIISLGTYVEVARDLESQLRAFSDDRH
jgi:hypothetical protein